MADNVPPTAPTSTPYWRRTVQPGYGERVTDPAQIAELLGVLEAIPRDELPNGLARIFLGNAIRDGYVDNLYRPLGHSTHVIAWAVVEPHEDPRVSIEDWLRLCEPSQAGGAS